MALEGNLHDMSLVDLIQVFRTWPKTGFLLLVRGDERGIMYIVVGRMVDAVVVRCPNRQVIAAGEAAVQHLLQWEDATFTFRHNPAAMQRPVRIKRDSVWFMQQAQHRRKHIQPTLPQQRITLDTHLELTPLPADATSGVNLGLDQWQLLSQIATCKNLRELCQQTNMTPHRALQIAGELADIGLIEVVDREPPAIRQQGAAFGQRQSVVAHHANGGSAAIALRATTVVPERGLLQAVMRRIRGL